MSVDIVIDQCPWCDEGIIQGNNVMDPDGLRWHHDCRALFHQQRRNEDLSDRELKRRQARELAHQLRGDQPVKRGPGRPRKQAQVDVEGQVQA